MLNKYKKVCIATCIIIGLLLVDIIFIKYKTQKSVQFLQHYENTLLAKANNVNEFQHPVEFAEILDSMEDYISKNQNKMLIRKYSRSSNSIMVEFYLGIRYIIIPAEIEK